MQYVNALSAGVGIPYQHRVTQTLEVCTTVSSQMWVGVFASTGATATAVGDAVCLFCLLLFSAQAMAITPQTPITPDSLSQVSPHGALEFIYPPPPSYEQLAVPTPMPATPTHTCVSPIVSYQQAVAWGSPPSSVPFDQTVDFSPIVSCTHVFVSALGS